MLLLEYSDVLYSSSGESGPGFFISAEQVSTWGSCGSIPYAGLTVTDTWLWSQPDGRSGEQLEKIRPAQRIFIQEGPVQGARPPDVSTDGRWYFVMVSPSNDQKYGWVWSSNIFIE